MEIKEVRTITGELDMLLGDSVACFAAALSCTQRLKCDVEPTLIIVMG